MRRNALYAKTSEVTGFTTKSRRINQQCLLLPNSSQRNFLEVEVMPVEYKKTLFEGLEIAPVRNATGDTRKLKMVSYLKKLIVDEETIQRCRVCTISCGLKKANILESTYECLPCINF